MEPAVRRHMSLAALCLGYIDAACPSTRPDNQPQLVELEI